MAQGMMVWMLLLLAAVAGGVCVWLLMRGNAKRAPDAVPGAVRPAPEPSMVTPAPGSAKSAPPGAPLRPLEPSPFDPTITVVGLQVPQVLSDEEIFHSMYELAFGKLARQSAPPEELSALAENASQLFEKLALDPKYAMRRPMMLPELLRAVHDRKSTQHQLAAIFARDPALAGNLLKVANSPLYRTGEDPVESLDRAVALLGTDGLHSLIATVLVQPVFKLAATHYPRFPEIVWEHTFRAASAAENHAAMVEHEDPFAAQLLALTMGLGIIVVYRIVMDRSREVLHGRTPHPSVIIALIDSQCAGVAKRVAASWDLSERVLTALEEQRPRRPGDSMATLSALGRSLAFGRGVAALAVLFEQGRISAETVRATIEADGPPPEQFETIWGKLINHKEPAPG